MRVFVFEYVSGGGFAGQPMVASLVAEGDLMLAAAVRDLLGVPGVAVSTCRDHRLEMPPLPFEVTWVEGDWQSAWLAGVDAADAVLPIAPETDGILETLCRDVQRAGKILLNSRPHGVALAASKLATFRRLAAADVPVVTSWEADRVPSAAFAEPLVVKPDQGIGCQGIHLLNGERALADFLAHQENSAAWLVQPYVAGVPASLSVMVGDDCLCLLGANRQRVAQVDDGFVLLGCVVNGIAERSAALLPVAQRVCRAIDGLWGYVGIDLVLAETGPRVLEVNPRLTTSYVGLSRSLGRNVAGMLLQLADDGRALPGRYLPGSSVHVDLELGRVA